MKKYLIALTAPSLGLIHENSNYIEPYIISAENLDELGIYVDSVLMRKFALNYKVSLSDVKILFAAPLK